MVKKSINIDHTEQSINVDDNSCLTLNENGAVLLGSGITIPDTSDSISLSNFEGSLRFNENTKKVEYCDGEKWVTLMTKDENDQESTIFSIIF